MKVSFFKGKQRFSTDVREVKGLEMGIGLIFRPRQTSNLLFDFGELTRIAITGLLVFFPFVAIWLDARKQIVDVQLVRPFQISARPKKDACYLIEVPLNERNKKLLSKMDTFLKGTAI